MRVKNLHTPFLVTISGLSPGAGAISTDSNHDGDGMPGLSKGSTDSMLVSSQVLKISCVADTDGNVLGQIQEFVLDLSLGVVAYVMVSFGNEKHDYIYAIPWPLLSPVPEDGVFYLSINPLDMQGAPAFARDDAPHMADRSLAEMLYRFYQCAPYWEPEDRD